MLTDCGMLSVFIYGLKYKTMNTKEFLKAELDKIDKNIFYEIDGYGNIEHIVNVMELYAMAVNKNCNIPRVISSFVCGHPPKQTYLNNGTWHCEKCGGKWESIANK